MSLASSVSGGRTGTAIWPRPFERRLYSMVPTATIAPPPSAPPKAAILVVTWVLDEGEDTALKFEGVALGGGRALVKLAGVPSGIQVVLSPATTVHSFPSKGSRV